MTIDRLGAQGDGIAPGPRGQVFVPFALPGEVANVAVEGERGTVMALLETSPLRVEPACAHFGTCGGCSIQHLADEHYRAWKRGKVVDALAARGVEAEVAPLVSCEPGERRRAAFSARKVEAGMILGYHRAFSHDLVDVHECAVIEPEIVAALPVFRMLAEIVCATKSTFRMLVTRTLSGFDIAVDGAGKASDAVRHAASAFVVQHRLARLTLDGELVVEREKPVVMAGEIRLAPPAGGFLQAVASAEAVMADLACGHVRKAKRVADLFAGSGAFALRLARFAEVHAVEGEVAALRALDLAFRHGQGLRKVTGERRDLFRRPLMVRELNTFDGVVFDPPRAGAEEQAKLIAKSDVPKIVAVSCNPGTLARDLRILVDGGYTIVGVTPIDQFLWSPHVEAVALLEKPRKRR